MNLSPVELGILMGIGGTIAMDILAIIQHWAFKMPLPNWGYPGRWFAHLPQIFHEDIATTPAVKHEVAIGWAFHYGVGIIYGIFWILIAGESWIAEPTFFPLWIFALVTIAAGWFLLQPGMGLGWALAKTATPWKGRFLGLVAHTVFGLGMWLPALL